MTKVRSMVNEAAILADSWSWHLFDRPLPITFPAKRRFIPRPVAASTPPGRLRVFDPASSAPRQAARLARSRIVYVGALAALLGFVGTAAWGRHEAMRLVEMSGRLIPVAVVDANGTSLGALPRSDALTSRDGSGRTVIRANIPIRRRPVEFLRLAGAIEGEGVLGVSPQNLLRSSVCYVARHLGLSDSEPLRLKQGKCAGASTLLAQAVRSLTDARHPGAARKVREVMSSVALASNLSGEERDRFIANTLYFGDAGGQPIIGLGSAAMTIFGKDAGSLEPYESAYLAALPLYPARLACGHAAPPADRFARQIDRAELALRRALAGDPRLAGELARLRALAPIHQPAPDPAALEAGLGVAVACHAGSGPLGRFEALDSSVRIALQAELERSGVEAAAGAVRLTVGWDDQPPFKSAIKTALAEMALQQSAGWITDPRGEGVIVLAFVADETGGLTQLYQSGAMVRLNLRNELGSLAKLPALVILAEQGWDARAFCNRAATLKGRRLHNAGGDAGVLDCGAGISPEEVWGRSLSLAVYDALRMIPQATIRQRLGQWHVNVPARLDPAYALSFGLVSATPADFSAFLAALSAGNSGKPALGYRPHLVARSRPAPPDVDLRAVFARPGATALIARASGAALTYRGTRGSGTLVSLGLPALGAVGKTGTLDDEDGRVRYKAAAGGLGGRVWVTMVFPASGALGGSAISILPLAKRGQDAMMRGNQVKSN